MTQRHERIIKWRKKGWSYKRLAKKFKTSLGLISNVLMKYGVRTRRNATVQCQPSPVASKPSSNGYHKALMVADVLERRAKAIRIAVRALESAM